MTDWGSVSKGFLTRLLRNKAGNTLAMVAGALFPLLGLIGGGVDMSRIYLTKARLQQACDAGALAGRKAMGSGAWAATGAETTANNMFSANFVNGAYGTTGLTKAYTESAGTVTGTASVSVPMTIMKVFGKTAKSLVITCDAAMRIPNTDVMFVLDTTGSMGDIAPSDTVTKIAGLKLAVKCFYEALAKVDISDANCGSTPSGGNSASVQLRFGFVPYASNVNVGALLKNEWMADSWTYQSRSWEHTPYTTTTSTNWQYLSGLSVPTNETGKSSCPASTNTTTENPSTSSSLTDANGIVTTTTTQTRITTGVLITNPKKCTTKNGASYTRTEYTNYTEQKVDISIQYPYAWVYKPVTFDVSGLKAGGSTWNTSINLPLGAGGASTSVAWGGCIEERQSWQNTDGDPSDDFSPIPASAYDLDIDMVPDPGNPATQWKPLLPNAVWGRYDSAGNWSYANVTTTSDLSRNYSYTCPVAARKLQSYPTSTAFKNYVNSLSASGNTYHDIGLVWGARLMSPTGLFASENAFTPSGGTIERHLIFMTDGDTVTNSQGYISRGVEWWDRRQTSSSTAPSNSILDATVNAHTEALCTAIKNKNITLWVISYGSGVSTEAQTRLENCASPGRFYAASDSSALIANFKAIADEISQLRLTH